MASGSNGSPEKATSPTDVIDGQQSSLERAEVRNKTPRHPRWTRQETVVLIEGKKIAEERGRRGRRPNSVFGSDQLEPKWDSVSSFCRRHGVNRGPVQCRKRWSNLVSDFKKIKLWESQDRTEGESFWTMRSDLRRERKLPGFFDKEVYDALDGKAFATSENQLALVVINADEKNGDHIDDAEADDEDEETEDDEPMKAFSEFEQVAPAESGKENVQTDAKAKSIPSPVPISEMKYQRYYQADSNQENKRRTGTHFWRDFEFHEGVKRQRTSSSDVQNTNVNDLLIKALDRNTNLLNAQLENQKLNCQLDREQHKEQHESLIACLTKITDALEKIANKL